MLDLVSQELKDKEATVQDKETGREVKVKQSFEYSGRVSNRQTKNILSYLCFLQGSQSFAFLTYLLDTVTSCVTVTLVYLKVSY